MLDWLLGHRDPAIPAVSSEATQATDAMPTASPPLRMPAAASDVQQASGGAASAQASSGEPQSMPCAGFAVPCAETHLGEELAAPAATTTHAAAPAVVGIGADAPAGWSRDRYLYADSSAGGIRGARACAADAGCEAWGLCSVSSQQEGEDDWELIVRV